MSETNGESVCAEQLGAALTVRARLRSLHGMAASKKTAKATKKKAALPRRRAKQERFDDVDLSSAVFHNVTMKSVSIDDADMARARLHNVTLRASQIDDADLREAQLTNVDLSNAVIDDANLSGARLNNVNLAGVVIEDAAIEGLVIEGFRVDRLIEAARSGKRRR